MREHLHLNGELLFTVRKSGPLRMTQAQVGGSPQPPREAHCAPKSSVNSGACQLQLEPADRPSMQPTCVSTGC